MQLGPGEYSLIALLVAYTVVIPLVIWGITGKAADQGSLVLTMPVGMFGPGIVIQSMIEHRYLDAGWQLIATIALWILLYWIGTRIKAGIDRGVSARVDADIERARRSLNS